MAHEERDCDSFFRQARYVFKPGERLLIPGLKAHVMRGGYGDSADAVTGAGFMPEREVEVSMSRSCLFARP